MTQPLPASEPSGVSILLVDDEIPLLNAYSRTLAKHGFRVDTAADGAGAIAKLGTQSYDVIVSDLAMPGMDGIQLLRRVRERDLDVPVILMTGSPMLDSAIRAVELGALRYLIKPFDLDVLVGAVQHATRLHRLARLKREALGIVGEGSRQLGDLVTLGHSFERALASLWMAYQPIVSLGSRRIFAFEALLRSTETTLPHPGAIIEAAERLDRTRDLGRAIRARVAADIRDVPDGTFFVNLHTRDLLDDELLSRGSPLSQVANRVVLEITERASLDEVKDVAARITTLRGLGFRVAIDDLGAGYAGLSSFTQIEPEVVKFDMSLVRDVHNNPTKKKLIQSMATLFAEMGLLVIAEGVETVDERQALREAGCDLLQGYLFAKPGRPFPEVAWE